MEEKLLEILEAVHKVFMRYGIKSVTMDDVARELKQSKKTIYKYVSDKAELVSKVMQYEIDNDIQVMDEIVKSSKNAIEEQLGVIQHIGKKVRDIHPSIHYDLEKYYPEAWEIFDKHKKGFILNCVITNLERGMKEGLYRENLNPKIVAVLHVGRIDMLFDGTLFPPDQFNFGDVFIEAFRYHIKGIASDKGIKTLNEKIKNDKLIF